MPGFKPIHLPEPKAFHLSTNHAAQSCLAAVFVFLLAAIQYLHQEDKVKKQNKTELAGQGRESTQTGKINEEVYPVICTIN